MAPFSSADPNAYVGIAMQSALGTPQLAATKFRFAKFLSGNSFNPDLAVTQLREGGDGFDYGSTYKTLQKMNGQLVFNARPEILAQALQGLPGNATWNGASAPAIHTFSAGASHPWFTIVAGHPGTSLAMLMADVRFTGFTLEAAAGQPYKMTMPYTGIQLDVSNASSVGVPTYISEAFFLYYNNPSYMVDGAADSTIESWKLDYKLGVEELQAQSIQLDDIVVQNRDLDVEIVRRYQNSTGWQKINTGAGSVPTQSVATGTAQFNVLYGAGTSLRSLNVNLPLLSYIGDALTELDPDGKTIRETISAQALKPPAGSLVTMVVTNTHASAYAP